jgi:hypothetical protein
MHLGAVITLRNQNSSTQSALKPFGGERKRVVVRRWRYQSITLEVLGDKGYSGEKRHRPKKRVTTPSLR